MKKETFFLFGEIYNLIKEIVALTSPITEAQRNDGFNVVVDFLLAVSDDLESLQNRTVELYHAVDSLHNEDRRRFRNDTTDFVIRYGEVVAIDPDRVKPGEPFLALQEGEFVA